MSFEVIYATLDRLLPFEWLQYGFMKNALIAVLLVTPVFGLLGTMVVNNKMAFFSDSIGHSALTGIALGVVFGIKQPLWSMLIFAILMAIMITVVKNTNTASTDTVISVFSSTAVAIGIVILSMGKWGGFSKYSTYLIGDLLSISSSEIMLLAGIAIGIIVIWLTLFNKLLVVSINSSLAGSRGIKVKILEMFFTIVVAIVVTLSIRWVGILIINSLLILPAAAARNVSKNSRQYVFISLIISLISGLTGLILSYYWGTATGATIVLMCAVFFAITFGVRRLIY